MIPARIFGVFIAFAFLSCVDGTSPSGPNGVSTLSLRILDSSVKVPGVESFEVEIEKIEINHKGEFKTIFEGPAAFDLYADKSDPLIEIASIPIREGVVNQARVWIGQARAFAKNGDPVPVEVASAGALGTEAPISSVMNIIPGGVEFELDIDFELSSNLTPQGSGLLFRAAFKVYNKTYRKHLYGKLSSDACSPGVEDDFSLPGIVLELRKNSELVQEVETYKEGKFLFVGLRPGEYTLHAGLTNHKESIQDVRIFGADTQISLRLAGKCSSISGSVLNEKGAPIADANVALLDFNGVLLEEVLTLPNGSFRTSRQFEGDYILSVEALNYAPHAVELYEEDGYGAIQIMLEEEL